MIRLLLYKASDYVIQWVFRNCVVDTVAREFSENEIALATGHFSDENELGKGGFGTVYLAYLNGTKVAVKRFTEVCAHGVYSFTCNYLESICTACQKRWNQHPCWIHCWWSTQLWGLGSQ